MTGGFWDRLRTALGFGAAPLPAPAPAAPAAPAAEPGAVDPEVDERLPDSSLERVHEIRRMAAELEHLCRSGGLIEEMIEIERLRTSHLPVLLRSYVAIPPGHRAEVFRETGRSASFLLNERLDKILARLREMSRQLARGNVDDFTQNIRFVDMNYGQTSPFD